MGLSHEAFDLIDKSDIKLIQNDKRLMGIYLNLLADKDMEKAGNIMRDLEVDEVPRPADLFDIKLIEQEGLTEEECLQRLIDSAMPEKVKEHKTQNIKQEMTGGAEFFIPKKRKHRKIRYPKEFDPKLPGPGPDAERWLPKWQRSKFKKLAKKKGIYLKGAQGDAQIDTDVTSGNMQKSTTHIEAKQAGNKRRKK